MKIAIGNDHAASELKLEIKKFVEEMGHEVTDFGCAPGEAIDYPVPGKNVGVAVTKEGYDLGILICGTGVGISMAANKVDGVRACCCSDTASARLTREHNNANIICFGARIVGLELAKDIVKTFINTPFSGEERHQRRIDLITEIEKNQ